MILYILYIHAIALFFMSYRLLCLLVFALNNTLPPSEVGDSFLTLGFENYL